jgi:type VI secretion system protein ImpE
MKHEEYLRQGQLPEALASLQEQVRNDPANSKYRILLFQLLAVLGQWERALKQLDVIRGMDDSALAMVHLYRSAIASEMFREQVFRGEREPVFLGQPEEWQALLLQALKLTAEGKHAAAEDVRSRAFELAPTSGGTLNGAAFAWIADADPRLGPTLEVIIDGGYRWVSFAHIRTLTVEAPEDLRDVVWLPAHILWQSGGEAYALIPTRYPGSAQRAAALALSRRTEWEQAVDGVYLGYGQRMLATDADEYPLMEVRVVEFAPQGQAGDAG